MTYPVQVGHPGQSIQFTTSPNGPLDGSVPITFTVDNPAICSAAINNNATLTGSISLLAVGTATITAHATSEGVPLSEDIPVQVTANPATTFGFAFKPAA